MAQPITRRTFAALPLAASAGRAASVHSPTEFFASAPPDKVGIRPGVIPELTAYLQKQIDAQVIPGARVVATRHGKLFLEICLGGYVGRNGKAKLTMEVVQPLFSVSKMVTATAVVMTWQDGRLDIDVPAARYVPEFASNGKGKITIRQLMSHTAGIPVMQGLSGDTEEHWKAAVAKVCAMPLQWEPGSRTQYHGNTGMLISAEAVRRVTGGKPWNEICRERIFAPVGLASFTFNAPPPTVPLVLIAPPEDPRIGAAHYHTSTGLPAAGCYANPGDLLKFLNFQTNKGVWNGKALMQEKYWTAQHTVQFDTNVKAFDPWGFGMMVRGTGPARGGLKWFGIIDQTSPTVFTHVGTSCVMAVGDPAADLEIAFLTTDVPKTKDNAQEMRNTVTDKIFAAITA